MLHLSFSGAYHNYLADSCACKVFCAVGLLLSRMKVFSRELVKAPPLEAFKSTAESGVVTRNLGDLGSVPGSATSCPMGLWTSHLALDSESYLPVGASV